MIKKYFCDLKREFSGYNGTTFRHDLMAGLTVTAVAIPLALAFAVSSGVEAAAGLVCAVVAGLVIGLLSGASFQISGPTGAMAAILVSIATQHGIQAVFVAGLLSGVILLLAGLLRFGRLVQFIPSPVIAGFTSGIAVIIALGQIDNFFGVHSEGTHLLERLGSYGKLGFSPVWQAVVIGGTVMAVQLLWPKKLGRIVPGSLVAIVVAVAVNAIVRWDVAIVGDIPKQLVLDNRLSLGALDWARIQAAIGPALTIATLGMVESLLCGVAGGRMKNEKLDADRELVAQGVGNMILPFFGAIPATAAIARSSVAIKANAQTRLAGIIHALGILASMFVLAPVMRLIPMPALAGVLIVTAWRMNDWENIRYYFQRRFYSSMLFFGVTMLATVALDLSIAIAIGVALSLLHFVITNTRLAVEISEVRHDEVLEKTGQTVSHLPRTQVVYITGPLFFGNVGRLQEACTPSALAEIVIFSVRGLPTMDASSAHAVHELVHELRGLGKRVLFCGVQPPVLALLRRAGVLEEIGEDNICHDALAAIQQTATV